MSLRSIHVVQYDRISFLWLNNMPLYVYTTFSSSIYLLKANLFIFVHSSVEVATNYFSSFPGVPRCPSHFGLSALCMSPNRNHSLGQSSEKLECLNHAPCFVFTLMKQLWPLTSILFQH